jgi:uncharacterized membrane protein
MARVVKSIEVGLPVATVYNQWTQFEQFPAFMAGVTSVRQIDDRRSHWHARVAGKSEEWDAVIQEQVPGEKIVWRNEAGAVNAGIVSFEQVVDGRTRNTRIHLEMAYEPEGLAETHW